jgi:hypothetical protein
MLQGSIAGDRARRLGLSAIHERTLVSREAPMASAIEWSL